MMQRNTFIRLLALMLIAILGLTGCSRTIDDVAKWKASGNTAKLIKALSDPKVEVRQGAAEALGELKAGPAVDALAALYNDPEEGVVLTAVNALAAIGTPSTTTPMIAALKLDNPEARTTAATALGELAATAAVEPLSEALEDTEESVQLAAATSLGQIGDEAGSKALVKQLSSGSDAVRLACAEALRSTGGDVAADGLIGALADFNGGVRKAAETSLVAIGKPSAPYALKALRSGNKQIRAGAIGVLREIKSIPLTGSDAIWFTLAKVSVDRSDAINPDVVKQLAKRDDEVETLLEACAHSSADFREHTIHALEIMGEPVTAQAVSAAEAHAGPKAIDWFNTRGNWNGYPSWRIDLWAALAALNPDFELDMTTASSLAMQGRPAFNVIASPQFKPIREYIPLLIGLLGDQTEPPPEEPDYDEEGLPIIKKHRDTFRGKANQEMAKDKLEAAGDAATLPLIAALQSNNALVAGHAAELLGDVGEMGALQPLQKTLAARIEAGEHLSNSPFYNALQQLEDPSSEPLLLKVRPNSERAMRVFNRKYPDHRALSAETKLATGDYNQPITFRLGYIDNGRVAEMPVTFTKDGNGDWKPSPALPDQPSSITM